MVGQRQTPDASSDAVGGAMVAGRPSDPAMQAALRVVQSRMFPRTVRQLGRYLLLDELGRGGMGVVYRAYDPELDRRVAVKLVSSTSDAAVLRREAQALARLSHRNVVPVYDVGSVTLDGASSVYIVMELVDGQTLEQWLATGERDLPATTSMFVAAARGLAAAHAAGIVHRDFKPSNVVIDQAGEPRVLDFGLADLVGAVDSAHDLVRGTPPFMPPEQLQGRPVDARGDQYALSVAMYRALGGVFPFPTEPTDVMLDHKVRHALVPMLRPCPPRLLAALARGLQADPGHRFASLSEWIVAVDDATDRRRRRWWALAAATGAAIAVGAAIDLAHRRRLHDCLERARETAWDDDMRARTREAFVGAHGEAGARTFAVIDVDLVPTRDALANAQAGLCEARASGALPEAVAHEHASCLAAVADEFAAFTEVLADDTEFHGSSDLLVMPDVAACERPREGSPADDDTRASARVFGRFEALLQLGRYTDAEVLLTQSAETLAGGSGATAVRARLLEAKLLRHRGESRRAAALAFEAVELADADNLTTLGTYAMLRLVDALVVDALQVASPLDDPERWLALANSRIGRAAAPTWLIDFAAAERVDLLRARGGDQAIAAARELVALRVARLGDHHRATLSARDALGVALAEAGQNEEARAELHEALDGRIRQLGEDHPSVARSLNNVAMTYPSAADAAPAIALLSRALDIDERDGEVGSVYWRQRALNRVRIAVRGRTGDPVAWAREAIAELAGQACDEPLCAELHVALAQALIDAGLTASALPELATAMELLDGGPGTAPALRHDIDALVAAASSRGAPLRDDDASPGG